MEQPPTEPLTASGPHGGDAHDDDDDGDGIAYGHGDGDGDGDSDDDAGGDGDGDDGASKCVIRIPYDTR